MDWVYLTWLRAFFSINSFFLASVCQEQRKRKQTKSASYVTLQLPRATVIAGANNKLTKFLKGKWRERGWWWKSLPYSWDSRRPYTSTGLHDQGCAHVHERSEKVLSSQAGWCCALGQQKAKAKAKLRNACLHIDGMPDTPKNTPSKARKLTGSGHVRTGGEWKQIGKEMPCCQLPSLPQGVLTQHLLRSLAGPGTGYCVALSTGDSVSVTSYH